MEKVDKLTLHKAKAFLIVCMDFRFIPDTMEHMKAKGYLMGHDMYVAAGVSLGFNQKTNPEWAKAMIDHIEISKKLHHIEQIILMDHMDCGAYKTFCPEIKGQAEEHKAHLKNLAEAQKKLKERFPDLDVLTWILHVDGQLEEVNTKPKIDRKGP